jgi:D-glycero-alpha-D-manno-heptose-7-phosphate kinase
VLFYSGQSRNSGINNWALFKGFIDGEKSVRERFAAIVAATQELGAALRAQDWQQVREAIHREWLARRTLAEGISTPAMDRAFAVCEKEFGGTGKICGAGGGGCFFLYTPDADPGRRKELIQQSLQAAGEGVRVLDFRAVPHGLEVRGG